MGLFVVRSDESNGGCIQVILRLEVESLAKARTAVLENILVQRRL